MLGLHDIREHLAHSQLLVESLDHQFEQDAPNFLAVQASTRYSHLHSTLQHFVRKLLWIWNERNTTRRV